MGYPIGKSSMKMNKNLAQARSRKSTKWEKKGIKVH